jgi:hypothetical protein
MIKFDEVPISPLIKTALLWKDRGAFYTENFPEFIHFMAQDTSGVRTIRSDDFFFVVEDNLPRFKLNGYFSNWKDLLVIRDFLKTDVHVITRFAPPKPDGLIIDPFLLYQKDHHQLQSDIHSLGEMSVEEADAFARKMNPELSSRFFTELLKDSIRDRLFSVIRDDSGKIVFLHLVRKQEAAYDGVYLWSSLTFPETAREYLLSTKRMGTGLMSSFVLQSNESSVRFHEFLGFKFIRKISYRVSTVLEA